MNHLRTLRCSAWLGWQIDSNWASPWLFALYVLVKPLAGSLLLVGMYWAVRGTGAGRVEPGFLAFLYVSSACFMLIGGVSVGMSGAVVADRESYGMLKYIRISPARFRSYLIGRGLSRFGQAALGAVLSMSLGYALFAELRGELGAHRVAPGWLLFYLFTGTGMMIALGLTLAAAVLNMARYGMFLSEGVAGVLFLLSGAVFPISVLPPWLRPLSMLLPPTYWLEGMRRSLLGVDTLGTPFASWGQGHIALALGGSTLVLAACTHYFFGWSERRAWRLGRYDESSGN